MATMTTADRMTGVAGRVAKPKRPAARVKPPVRKGKALTRWAYAGVGLTLALSAGLNGMAFAEHAPAAWAGWGLGFLIPVMVLVFSRVAVLGWAEGYRRPAAVGAGATLLMVLLSVQHLAASISRLTGESMLSAGLMAVAIDVGLVVCEVMTVKGK